MKGARNPVLREKLDKLCELQKRTSDQPYSVAHRLRLAITYRELGYPDLAAGDAYKVLLLVDEVVQEGEYHEEALEAAKVDIAAYATGEYGPEYYGLETQHGSDQRKECISCTPKRDEGSYEEKALSWAKTSWSESAYVILVGSLTDCGCLRSAFDFSSRALEAFPKHNRLKSLQKALLFKLRSYFEAKGETIDNTDVSEYPDKGYVRRELYPWNEYEPDRFSPEVLSFLNKEMECIAPKLEVKVAELPLLSGSVPESDASLSDSEMHYVKQLGVFAKEDIPPGEQILQEKSALTAVSRLHDSYCDACSGPLPDTRDLSADSDAISSILSCEDCEEVFFCSQECFNLAQETYHPSLCGISTEQKVPASEAADSLYTLLLIRALGLAETQECHPLELKEVRYIWGDYHGLDLEQVWKPDSGPFASFTQTLPFSFNANVLTPLHILEKMDVNIFEQTARYDTWVFNTLYAKFRGTASARQGLDGRPEIGAVHPMWCLANHSCDPNVAWEWQGSMRFWTREKLVEWAGRDATTKPGLRKGEEILSHYCDVTLPVKERREWAVGALGGLCICPRCVWEDAEETRNRSEIKSS